jgi:hypothetical protein
MSAAARLWAASLVLVACGASPPPGAVDPTVATARRVNQAPPPAASAPLDAEPASEPATTANEEPPPAPPAPPPTPVPVEPTDTDVAAAAHDADAGQHAAVVRRLRGAIARIDREAPLDERLLAHALYGRSLEARHDHRGALREYARVVDAWKDPVAAAREITGGSEDDGFSMKRMGRALNAVGEGLFFAAREKKKVADAAKPPPYAGPRTQEAVGKFVATKVKDWIQKRRGLVDDAEREFRKVLELQPVPPPLWVVASAAEVGDMLASFAAEVEKVPVPDVVRKDPELHGVFRSSLAAALEPQRERAKQAFRVCQAYAEKFRTGREHAEKCAKQLAELESAPAP